MSPGELRLYEKNGELAATMSLPAGSSFLTYRRPLRVARIEADLPEVPAPVCPPLGDDGRLDSYGGFALHHIAAYLPEGNERAVFDLLRANGIEVYRTWPVERETHEANMAALERDLGGEPE